LANAKDHKFSRTDWANANLNVQATQHHRFMGIQFAIALHIKRFRWRTAKECPFSPQSFQEITHCARYPRPEILIVGFKNDF
jgi:hypothetical protein